MATRRRTTSPESAWQVILEDIRSQNRATLEAVRSSHASLSGQIAEVDERLGGRLSLVEGAVRQNSADIRELKADVAGLKTDFAEMKADFAEMKSDVADMKSDLRRVEGKVDGLGPLAERVTALERSR